MTEKSFITSLKLTPDMLTKLRRLASLETIRQDKTISMSELIRQGIELRLAQSGGVAA